MTSITTALILALRIIVLGWLWVPRHMTKSDSGRGAMLLGFASFAGRALPVGLVLNLLAALCLAQLSLWTRVADWIFWGSLAVIGAYVRWRKNGKFCFTEAFLLCSVIALLTLLVLVFPPRSEWLAGGWDPGLYQNYAVTVARNGGFADISGTVYEKLNVQERALLGPEAFPGVPLEGATGAIKHYFFQLMPLCGAFFYRIGKLDLLVRINEILAMLGLPVYLALLMSLGLRAAKLAWAFAVWCVSPLWWYHQAVPTTEMLQILLLLGSILLYIDSSDNSIKYPVWVALLLCAVGINHFGFPALMALLLIVASAAEAYADRPGRLQRLVTCAIGLAGGLAWDLVFAKTTLLHLQIKDAAVTMVLSVFCGCLAAALVLSSRRLVRKCTDIAKPVFRWGGMSFGVLLLLIAALTRCMSSSDVAQRVDGAPSFVAGILVRYKGICQFMDPLWPFLTGLGVIGLVLLSGKSGRLTRIVAAGLGGTAFALLLNPGIAPFYPWALRRYVVFLLPASSIIIGCGLAAYPALIKCEHAAKWKNILLASSCCLILGVALKSARKAAKVGDYVGYIAVLDRIDAQVCDGDIIVADDARIGTPMLLAYGRNVLNGTGLWKSDNAEYRSRYMAMIRKLAEDPSARVLWLTSTEQGLDLYGQAEVAGAPLGPPVEAAFDTVIHSSRADRFAVRRNNRLFQLHHFQPGAP